ncbi:MAG: ClpXP protease specificity-enhancing factor SspB [Pseudomonadota bacterium]|nr:ClpXP protease specificity-enhancing factor SspB [Pseudomonadota bacterium]
MSKDLLNYETMVERALKSVVVEALTQVAENGLPGSHHLYVTFATDFPGVELPDHLHEKFPEEMTIVLQHQFWDLTVEEDRFLVTLSFNDIQERLAIPFPAIKAFADPSVNFGLQLKYEGEIDVTSSAVLEEPDDKLEAEPEPEVESTPAETAEDDDNVVTLDTFRKK